MSQEYTAIYWDIPTMLCQESGNPNDMMLRIGISQEYDA